MTKRKYIIPLDVSPAERELLESEEFGEQYAVMLGLFSDQEEIDVINDEYGEKVKKEFLAAVRADKLKEEKELAQKKKKQKKEENVNQFLRAILFLIAGIVILGIVGAALDAIFKFLEMLFSSWVFYVMVGIVIVIFIYLQSKDDS